MTCNKRNHGYGRRMDYAGQQVLRERYGGGHHATQRTQGERWRRFAAWLKSTHGIRDMRDIAPAHLQAWAETRLAAGRAGRTIANEISAANGVLGHARHGAWHVIRPSAVVPVRDVVRHVAPASLDPAIDSAAPAALSGQPRAAAVYALAHATGMRSREASLANLDRLAREAKRFGKINIQDGTKGGRTAPRWVPITAAGQAAIAVARATRPSGSPNLLAPTETYKQWRNGELRAGRDALHQVGIPGYHDARAAYACARYAQRTGRAAPAVTGHRAAPRTLDQKARLLIAYELGHGRVQVAASYVGSAA